jgi:sterol O-acyltransferase
MFITFLVSSIFHEVVMSCITKKLRGYGFGAMMLQLPIVAVQKSRFFKGRKTLNVSSDKITPVFLPGSITHIRYLECFLLVLDDPGSLDGEFYLYCCICLCLYNC